MIAIFDYGAGNLRSVAEHARRRSARSTNWCAMPRACARAPKIILPGVGHFGQMMRALDDTGRARRAARADPRGRAVSRDLPRPAGAVRSERRSARSSAGLGLFQGTVQRFPRERACRTWDGTSWSRRRESRLLEGGRRSGPYVYFAHSYYVPVVADDAAICTYGVPYTAVLEAGNIFGVQFHPEKSGPLGLRIVRNFVDADARQAHHSLPRRHRRPRGQRR